MLDNAPRKPYTVFTWLAKKSTRVHDFATISRLRTKKTSMWKHFVTEIYDIDRTKAVKAIYSFVANLHLASRFYHQSNKHPIELATREHDTDI